ncbi:hypothetical protein [Mycolicibacterium llatzerense]|uniref:hypothetical protein n=1 Tax=Mycolicibacterium llatzerense TaxID=280871 RepID=UPI0008DD7576|nr:hypothetical protein [Mycolicibacterium llatzerense]
MAEYEVVCVDKASYDPVQTASDATAVMNARAASGWVVVAVTQAIRSNSGAGLYITFRRDT